MKGTTLTVDDLLGHMADACRKIMDYTSGMDEQAFYDSPVTIDAVVKNIEVLGEAANTLARNYPVFVEKETDVPWRQLYGMRNRLTHGYFDINKEIVWKTVGTDIPQLASVLADIDERHAGLIAATAQRSDRGR